MRSRLSILRFALTLTLLLEAWVSRAVTGSALHEAMMVAAMGLFALAWWGGPSVASLAGLVLATGLGLGGWWLFERGWAPVSLSEWPAAFHLALGLHFWLWTVAMGARRQKSQEVEAQLTVPATALLALGAGALAVWSAGTVEIYGVSVFRVRGLAAVGLGVAVLFAGGVAHGAVGGGTGARVTVARAVRPGGRRRVGRVAGGVAAMALGWGVVVWTQEGADRLAAAWFRWTGSWGQVTRLTDVSGQRPLLETGAGGQDGAMRELPRRADIRLDRTVRFRIQFDEARAFAAATRRPLYLRSSAMPILAGDGRLGPRRQGRWLYDSDDQSTDGVTRLAEDDGRPAFRYWILIDRAESGAIPLVTGTRSVGLPGIYAFADGWHQLSLPDHQAHVRFQAQAAPIVWGLENLPEDLAPGDAPDEDLHLPDTPLAGRIAALAREGASPGDSLHRRLAAIRRLLAERCDYSLNYENPGNLEPVENFLFAERRGHCELYAASTVMLLRALGVPARVAFGFTGGESDPARRLIAFRQFDYHSWAEVLVEGHGWIVFDTTPPGAGALRPPQPNPKDPALAAFDPALYEDLGGGAVMGVTRTSWVMRALAASIDEVSRWFPGLAALAGVGLAGGWWWRRGRRRGLDPGVGNGMEAEGAPSASRRRLDNLLQAYLTAWADRGCLKAPGQTLQEFLNEQKHRGYCGPEFDDLTHYLYRVRYAGEAADPIRERAFADRIAAFSGQGNASK